MSHSPLPSGRPSGGDTAGTLADNDFDIINSRSWPILAPGLVNYPVKAYCRQDGITKTYVFNNVRRAEVWAAIDPETRWVKG